MNENKIAIVGHGGVGNKVKELLMAHDCHVNIVDDKPTEVNKLNEKFVEFDEQKHVYDVLNKLSNVRYTKPVFHKCKSCGFLVVDYQLDKNGVCMDCRKVDE